METKSHQAFVCPSEPYVETIDQAGVISTQLGLVPDAIFRLNKDINLFIAFKGGPGASFYLSASPKTFEEWKDYIEGTRRCNIKDPKARELMRSMELICYGHLEKWPANTPREYCMLRACHWTKYMEESGFENCNQRVVKIEYPPGVSEPKKQSFSNRMGRFFKKDSRRPAIEEEKKDERQEEPREEASERTKNDQAKTRKGYYEEHTEFERSMRAKAEYEASLAEEWTKHGEFDDMVLFPDGA